MSEITRMYFQDNIIYDYNPYKDLDTGTFINTNICATDYINNTVKTLPNAWEDVGAVAYFSHKNSYYKDCVKHTITLDCIKNKDGQIIGGQGYYRFKITGYPKIGIRLMNNYANNKCSMSLGDALFDAVSFYSSNGNGQSIKNSHIIGMENGYFCFWTPRIFSQNDNLNGDKEYPTLAIKQGFDDGKFQNYIFWTKIEMTIDSGLGYKYKRYAYLDNKTSKYTSEMKKNMLSVTGDYNEYSITKTKEYEFDLMFVDSYLADTVNNQNLETDTRPEDWGKSQIEITLFY